MVTMHVHFPSSPYFVAFACVFCVNCVFLFIVINCSVAGLILTVVGENHPVAVVACPAARVMQNCVAQVTSKPTMIGSLVDWLLLAE